jgi:hypothetical protein
VRFYSRGAALKACVAQSGKPQRQRHFCKHSLAMSSFCHVERSAAIAWAACGISSAESKHPENVSLFHTTSGNFLDVTAGRTKPRVESLATIPELWNTTAENSPVRHFLPRHSWDVSTPRLSAVRLQIYSRRYAQHDRREMVCRHPKSSQRKRILWHAVPPAVFISPASSLLRCNTSYRECPTQECLP